MGRVADVHDVDERHELRRWQGIVSLRMDGDDRTMAVGVEASHHDLTAIPGGFATLMWTAAGQEPPCSQVEDASWAKTVANRYHANAVHCYPALEDAYTIGDRRPGAFVKVARRGALIWQFGGARPRGASVTGIDTWRVNHGHHLMPDGTFYFFDNNASEAWGYELDTAHMSATKTFMWSGQHRARRPSRPAERQRAGHVLDLRADPRSGAVGEADHESRCRARGQLRLQRVSRISLRPPAVLSPSVRLTNRMSCLAGVDKTCQ